MTIDFIHPVFAQLNMKELNEQNFDLQIEAKKDQLVGVFFWGNDCPNCDVAKKMLSAENEKIQSLGLTWFHVNTYNETELGVRFGLFGIPTFLFFYQNKKLGKISPFPGIDPFVQALASLKNKIR